MTLCSRMNWLTTFTRAKASTSLFIVGYTTLFFIQLSGSGIMTGVPGQSVPGALSQNPGSATMGVNADAEDSSPEHSITSPPTQPYVAGELIVKFAEQTSRSIDARLSVSELSVSPSESISAVTESSIDRLNQTYQVTSITPLFKDLKQRQLETGRSYVELAEEVDKHPQRKPQGATVPNLTNIYVLQLDESADIEELAKLYAQDPNVEYAEPNYIVSLPPDIHTEPNHTLTAATEPITPNDPYFSNQWALDRIHWKETWPQEQANASITIAVIDTGVDYNHPDLKDSIVKGYDFLYNDDDPMDDNGHGTHVAGIAAATTNNGIGIAGVAGGATIMPVKAFSKFGLSGDNVTVALAIKYAVDHGVDVINNSWYGTPSKFMEDMVNYAYSKGVVFVAAAGNEGDSGNPIIYPAAYAHVIAVAATNMNNERPSFSSSGDWVDVAAPGASIYSTDLNGGYTYKSGTSMAAPYVSGLAALILSKNPNLTPNVVENIIITSADDLGPPGRDNYYGSGIINVQKALQQTPYLGLIANITSPLTNDQVFGKVRIKGTAAGEKFQGYQLDYIAGFNPTEAGWITIKPYTTTPVVNGNLAIWDTTLLSEDSYYTLRLKVMRSDGIFLEDRVVVWAFARLPISLKTHSVNGVQNSFVYPETTVNLLVTLQNKSSLVLPNTHATLTTTSPQHITLINSQVNFGNVAALTTFSNPPSQPYSFEVKENVPFGHIVNLQLNITSDLGSDTEKFNLYLNIAPGWSFDLGGGSLQSPIAADIIGLGEKVIFAPSAQLYTLTADGRLLGDTPLAGGKFVVVGDIDGGKDKRPEIVTTDDNTVFAYSGERRLLWQTTVRGTVDIPIVLANLDSNPGLEVIVGSTHQGFGDPTTKSKDYLTVLDGQTGTVKLSEEFYRDPSSSNFIRGIASGDVDSKEGEELIVTAQEGYWTRVYLIRIDKQGKFQKSTLWVTSQ